MRVLNAVDTIDEWASLFKGKRVGLLTHAPAVDAHYRRTADVVAEKCRLVQLWGPEHGLDGIAQDGTAIDGSIDRATQIPVSSLFGKKTAPSPEELEKVDAVLCDFCDVGARFYTYLYTMSDTMIACGKAGVPFYVLDRFNPLGGIFCEGPLLKPEFSSFCGRFPIPVRHALTLGEAAKVFNERFALHCQCTVLPVKNWRRNAEFEDTGRCWLNPSPNLPSCDAARLYLGSCLLEGTNVSEGRGTTRPFELIGAPFLEEQFLADRFNACKIPGILARPCRFEPQSGKFSGQVCRGIQLLLTDRKKAPCFEAGLRLLEILREDCREFAFSNPRHFDHLAGSDEFRTGAISALQLIRRGRRESRNFFNSIQNFLLYR